MGAVFKRVPPPDLQVLDMEDGFHWVASICRLMGALGLAFTDLGLGDGTSLQSVASLGAGV